MRRKNFASKHTQKAGARGRKRKGEGEGREGEVDRHCSQSVEELAHIIQNILQHAFNKLLFRFHLFSLLFLFFLGNENKSSSWMAASLVKYAAATYVCEYLCVGAYTCVCVWVSAHVCARSCYKSLMICTQLLAAAFTTWVNSCMHTLHTTGRAGGVYTCEEGLYIWSIHDLHQFVICGFLLNIQYILVH